MPQTAYGYLISQVSRIEREVYAIRYPDIQYPMLVPVDTTAPAWIRTITHYSTDKIGEAKALSGRSLDMPLADITRSKFDVTVEMAGIGYDYSLEEINQARMLPHMNLTGDKARSARRSAEEYIDNIVLNGDRTKGWDSLINSAQVSKSDAAATGTSNSKEWAKKTAEDILTDVNTVLQGVYDDTNTVEMADTLLIPPTLWGTLTSKLIANTAITIGEFIKRANVYTMKTGSPLMIREVRGLQNAAAGNTGRMIAYRRDPEVLKLHMPMPHRFLPPQRDIMRYIVPGIFRLGGLEIRLPKAIRYLDGITA